MERIVTIGWDHGIYGKTFIKKERPIKLVGMIEVTNKILETAIAKIAPGRD